jgi:pentatricopeptide repeat protein
MSSEVEAIEDKVRHHASRLETLTGDDNKRVRKRVLAALGKLKKELEQKKQKTGGDDDTDLKTVHPPNFDATTNSNAQSLTKKKLKNKVNLLNNEIKELAQKKCLKLAVKKFNWGVAKGYPVNVHTYTNLLNAYVRCVDMQGAEQLIAEMASKNLPLNVVVFTALLKGYAETGNLHEMTSIVFQRMPDASVDLNIRTVHTFLRGCVRIGAVESGLKLSEHAVVCGTKLDWSSISSLVQLLSQSLSVDKAEEVLERHITESDSEVSLFHKCMSFMHLASAYLLKGTYRKHQYL